MGKCSGRDSFTEKDLKLDHFFHPKSIAVVGASQTAVTFGNRYISGLLQYGYWGSIFPVNQNGDPVLGLKGFRNVAEIPDAIDLAVISVPNRFVPGVLRDCLTKNINSAVVLSSGFNEIGNEGRMLEQEITDISRSGIHIMGPNCFGVYCPSGGLTIIPGPNFPRSTGEIAFISQSGQFSEMVILRSIGEGIRFSKVISYGNACDLNEADLVEYLARDNETKIIQAYIEGVKNGHRFFEVVRKYAGTKPIMIWKVGLTRAGGKAASSHTGSMAGAKTAWDTFFQQSHVTRIRSLEELVDASMAFTCCPDGCGPRVALVSGGGGGTVVGADALEEAGLNLPAFTVKTQERLATLLPTIGASIKNPVDVGAPFLSIKMMTEILEAVASDENIDVVIIRRIFLSIKASKIITGGHIVPESEQQVLMDVPVLIKNKYGKPVIIVINEENASSDTLEVEAERRRFRDYYISQNIPIYTSESRAAAAIGHLAEYRQRRQFTMAKNESAAVKSDVQPLSSSVAQEKIKGRNGLTLDEIESKNLLKKANIDVVDTILAKSKEEALVVCRKLGFPVAMKIISPQITHKTDIGGVRLGITTEKQASEAYDEIIKNVSTKSPSAAVAGISVQKMAPPGIELVIGMTRDEQFGPMIMFGLGGIYIEAVQDVSFRIVPLIVDDAKEMIHQIRGYRLLTGFRGQPPVNEDKLQQMLINVSKFVECHPEIKEMDINPIMARGDEIVACDARIILENI